MYRKYKIADFDRSVEQFLIVVNIVCKGGSALQVPTSLL